MLTATYQNIRPVTASNEASGSGKIPWVYHARGLAIIMVVYRHIVIGMQSSGIQVSAFMYDVQDFFFNFRMPAFFILSGVFLAKSLQRKSSGTVVKDKVYTLLYPYIVWATITIILQIQFNQFANANRNWSHLRYIITQPRALDHLWYLLALFNAGIIYIGLGKALQKQPLLHMAIALVLHAFSFYVQSYSIISDLFYFYCFFLAGTWLSAIFLNAKKREQILNTTYLRWLLPLFFAGQYFWFFHQDAGGLYEVLFLLIIAVGCYVLFLLAVVLSKTKHTGWLSMLGKYSLYIYLLHVQVGAIVRKLLVSWQPQTNAWLVLLVCIAGGMLIPVLLVKYLRPFGIERLFTLQSKKGE